MGKVKTSRETRGHIAVVLFLAGFMLCAACFLMPFIWLSYDPSDEAGMLGMVWLASSGLGITMTVALFSLTSSWLDREC